MSESAIKELWKDQRVKLTVKLAAANLAIDTVTFFAAKAASRVSPLLSFGIVGVSAFLNGKLIDKMRNDAEYVSFVPSGTFQRYAIAAQATSIIAFLGMRKFSAKKPSAPTP